MASRSSILESFRRAVSAAFAPPAMAAAAGLLLASGFGAAAAPVHADIIAANVRIAADKPGHPLGTRLYGAQVEHMFHAIQGGLWGELLANRKLVAGPPAEDGRESDLPAPWFRFGDRDASVEMDDPKQALRPGDLARSFRLQAPEGRRVGVAQSGLALRPGDTVRLTVWLRSGDEGSGGGGGDGGSPKLSASLGDAAAFATVLLPAPTTHWRRATLTLTLPRAAREARLTLALAGPGVAWLYAPSLMTPAAVAAGGFDPLVLARARSLAPQFLRYPGGNFAQNYRWRDGVGPRDERPARRNIWGAQPEPNDVGVGEFIALCRRLKAEPALVVNVGGRGSSADEEGAAMGAQEAADWVAYCNGSAQNSPLGRLRAAHGYAEPFNVRLWEIGNEIFGDWVAGHTDAATYARNFDDYVRAMRALDPRIQVIAVGQSPAWNAQLIAGSGTPPDFLSLHLYVAHAAVADVLAEPVAYEAFLRAPLPAPADGDAAARGSATKRRPPLRLAVNEWNLNLKEANQTWLAGLFAASLLHVFQRTPAVEMAAVNGLVNGWEGGVIQREGTRWFATPVHTVLSLYRRHTGSRSLPVLLRAREMPLLRSEALELSYPAVDIVASRNRQGQIFVSVVNKSPEDAALLSFRLDGYAPRRAEANLWILSAGPQARNDWGNPERLQPVRRRLVVTEGRFVGRFPPLSVTCIALVAAAPAG